jgi:hypothetical protein
MYKFLLNCPEPPAKKAKISEGQRKYEKENRKRIFLPRWEKEFTWLKTRRRGWFVLFAIHIGSFITGVLIS